MTNVELKPEYAYHTSEELSAAQAAILEQLKDFSDSAMTVWDVVRLDLNVGYLRCHVQPASTQRRGGRLTWRTDDVIRNLESTDQWYPNSWLSQARKQKVHKRNRVIDRHIQQPKPIVDFSHSRKPLKEKAVTVHRLIAGHNPHKTVLVPLSLIVRLTGCSRPQAQHIRQEMLRQNLVRKIGDSYFSV